MSALLNLIVIRTRDLQEARRFYEALGLSFTEECHGRGPEHLACDLGGLVLEIYPRRGTDDTSAVRLGFTVASLRGTLEALERQGVGVPSARDERSVVVHDPDGHTVELREGP